ncbi:hypothetical protein EV700_0860 [Fluviicoccus keumensis]|uniref:Lipoprotein n=1 Tax=Fluviicoccus keumensis TaxID=1435465 RepID=A0A4Q7ZCZ2_9GAMM|nr:hypothetical protein [Fluviicoccus keumensis]RZU47893.1 hypothetical protein EV700_0860 [Fluviicoccus keumensis]
MALIHQRPFRRLAVLLLPLSLTACDHYPEGWPEVKTAWRGCPSLDGTYLNPKPAAGQPTLLAESAFAESLGKEAGTWPWTTLNLSGDPANHLLLRWGRSLQTLQDWTAKQSPDRGRDGQPGPFSPETRWSEEFRALNDADYEKRFEGYGLPAGSHALYWANAQYHCDSGWLVTRRVVADADGNLHTDGEIRFARDSQGGLIVHSTHSSGIVLGKVCRYGLCIPLPFGEKTEARWERWAPAAPDAAARPWNHGFSRTVSPEGLTFVHDSDSRTGEVRDAINALGIAGLTVDSVTPTLNGGGVFVTLTGKTTAPFNGFFQATRDAARFHHIDIQSLDGDAAQGWRMTVLLGLRPKPSATSTAGIAQQVTTLLPDGAALTRVEPYEDGFRVTIHANDEGVIQESRRQLEDSDRFRQARVETHFTGAEGIDLVMQVWEREE